MDIVLEKLNGRKKVLLVIIENVNINICSSFICIKFE